MFSTADCSVAKHARDAEPDGDVQDVQAQHIAQNMRAFAQKKMNTDTERTSQLDCVPDCLKNVVELVNTLSRPWLSNLFEINYVKVPTKLPHLDTFDYYLQVTCKFYATGDVQSTNIIDPSQEAVVSRLYIRISKRATEMRQFKKPHPCINVCMDHGATALCVRRMHLATLLRICALMLAQQIAYCGSTTESVCFEGEAVSDATIKIYTDLFRNLHAAEDMTSGNLLLEAKAAQCLELYAQVFNPGASIPQTIINASNMLSNCRGKSGDLCDASFPRQIRNLTEQVRTRKTAKVETRTQPASASFVHAHWQAHAFLPVCYARCCVLKPVYFK
jgi:hypothetical protein